MVSSNSLVLYEKLYVNNTLVLSYEFTKLTYLSFTAVIDISNDLLTFSVKFNKINELKVGADNEPLIIKFNITNPELVVNVSNYTLIFIILKYSSVKNSYVLVVSCLEWVC